MRSAAFLCDFHCFSPSSQDDDDDDDDSTYLMMTTTAEVLLTDADAADAASCHETRAAGLACS